ncbi:uncharacterized protein C8A04DRAFT_13001 [Dichotomopilus funicola]|uniref:NACHT domain-containing protein n=1 Tax=Dichotomopilus funicola TaxID=1934379 RepID=A0AAN6ZLC1_9PEZI|nr:hypothetical protein C8A04DRAFT_13001 [Dichotomopilus funicola]
MPLKAPPPELSASRRAIENAFKDLERTISPAESRDFASTTLEDVRRAAFDLERQLAARQSLRNMRRLEPLFQGLHHYAKVIEVLCNGTPYLPWIWAPIKFILKISSDYTQAFDRIIKAYSQIAESLGRFQLLEESFKGKPQIFPVFVIFYIDILRFHKAAYKFLTRHRWKVLFMTTWGRFEREFNIILDNLTRHQDLIDKEVNAHNIIEARAMRETLKSWRAECLDHLVKDQKQLTVKQLQGVMTWLRLDESDQIVLFDSLDKVGEKNPGTVNWILKKPQVASWLGPTPDTPFLCLQGAPGTGKSIIVAQLVSFLNASKRSPVIRHFCSYTHESSTRYDQVIKSLLLQLAQHSADLVAHIHEEYVGSKQATVRALEELLEIAVGLLSSNDQRCIHILLDGLDECPIDKQRRLLRLMVRLTEDKNINCKVLVSRRDAYPLPPKLRQCVFSFADEKACLCNAISTYARNRLSGATIRVRLGELGISEDEMDGISSDIGERADGIFASLFPPSAYEKLLSRTLSSLDARSALRLKAIFGWIAFAKRPLRKAELQSALMFQLYESVGDRPVPPHILEACKPLVEERRDSSLAFIHSSVKEYLQSDVCDTSIRMDKQSIHWDHVVALLHCVRAAFDVFTPGFPQNNRQIQVIRGVWGFLPFATEFWAVELQELIASPTQTWHPRLLSISSELSDVLATAQLGPDSTLSGLQAQEQELIRLYFPGLLYDMALSLQARGSGHRVAASGPSVNLVYPTRMNHIFENYEATVRHIVEAQDHSDAVSSEFQLFCSNFGGHAYLCRFVYCVHAISGFNSNGERTIHESGHRLSFLCPESGCQYPPFNSPKALKTHLLEKHQEDKRKCVRFRGIRLIATTQQGGAPHLNAQQVIWDEEPAEKADREAHFRSLLAGPAAIFRSRGWGHLRNNVS